MNCGERKYKIYHLSLNVFAKFECSNTPIAVDQFRSSTNSINNRKYLREMVSFYSHNSHIHTVYTQINYSMFELSVFSKHLCTQRVNGCANDAFTQCWAKNLPGAVAKYYTALTSSDGNSTQKTSQSKLWMYQKLGLPVAYHPKPKLTSDAAQSIGQYR